MPRCTSPSSSWNGYRGSNWARATNPLLVSVRSGAKFSMPGMMDTILNLGLNDQAVEALAKRSNNPRFAYDSYRRLIQMFGDVVLDIPKKKFEHIFDGVKQRERRQVRLRARAPMRSRKSSPNTRSW